MVGELSLPTSVRYVKNGRGGQWWPVAKANNQIHLGWKSVARNLLTNPDYAVLKEFVKSQYGDRPGAMQDFNALQDLLNGPSKHVWMTFQDGYMWWCTVRDGAIVNPDGESTEKGNFFLACDRPWSNRSLKGTLLSMAELPGSVTRAAGFRATVCTPKAWQAVLRIIRDEQDPDALAAATARKAYEKANLTMVKRLSPEDFEQLIDHILARTGWARISTLGKTREGTDAEAENVAVGEIAFVQVKSSASQQVLNEYVEKFNQRREYYARMIFAVHTATGKLVPPSDHAVQVWGDERIAELVVRLGLGEWVESRLA